MIDKNIDTFEDDTEIDWDSPDELLMAKEEATDTNEYREAAQHFLRVISLAVAYIINSRDSLSAAHGVAFSMGLPCCDRSMRAVARELGISSGTLSAHAKRFRLLSGLGNSLHQHKKKQKSK